MNELMMDRALKYMEPVPAEPFGTGFGVEVRHDGLNRVAAERVQSRSGSLTETVVKAGRALSGVEGREHE